MITVEILNQEIDKLEKCIAQKEKDVEMDRGKLLAYKSLIETINSQKKILTDVDLIRIAKKVISEDTRMQRVKKIVSALKDEGFDVDGNALSSKLIKTGKFRKDSKYWEIVNDEDVSGMFR